MSNVIKKSLQTTIFTTVLSTVLSFPAAANTINTDVIDIQPVTPWSVSLAAGGNTAQAYCTLSKTFKKNIILTLAENNENNLTFALDFQKGRFEPKSNYNIILATDNGDSRSYEVAPATNAAFIIRVKDDKEFYDNLWQSHSLIVSVNTENYRFNTADFLEGRQNISSCLASLKITKPENGKEEQEVSEIKPEISNIPVSLVSEIETKNAVAIPHISPAEALSSAPKIENAAFRTERLNKISKIAGEVEQLKTENASLKLALKSEREKFDVKMSEVAFSADNKSQDLAKQVSLLTSENDKLRSQIRENAKKQSIAATTLSDKLDSEINRLRTENNILKTSLDSTKAAQVQQINENKILKASLSDVRNAQEVNNLNMISLADYEALQTKNNVLIEQIRTLTTENHSLKIMASQNATSGINNNDVISQLKAENISLLSKNNDMSAEDSSLKEKIRLKDHEIASLKSSLNLAKGNVQNYDQMKQQISMLQKQNSDLANSYASLEAASGQATPSSADQELSSLQKRYTEQQMQMERMTAEMEKQRQEFSTEKQKLEAMLFDPAVTDKKQLEHLAKLENELKLANQALAEQRNMYEDGKVPNRVAELPAASKMSGAEQDNMMMMSNEIQRLREEIDRLRRLATQPQIEKATISEKKVIISKGETLASAKAAQDITPDPIENKIPRTEDAPKQNILPTPEEIFTNIPEENDIAVVIEPEMPIQIEPQAIEPLGQQNAPTVITPTKIEVAAIEMMESVKDASLEKPNDTPVQKEDTPLKPVMMSHSYQGTGRSIALPDPEMERILQKQDKNMKIKGRDQGTVFWTSGNDVEGTIFRKLIQGENFEASVDHMIGNLKNKCASVLNIEPLVLRKSKAGNLYAYDADCGSSIISLIFYSKDGQTLSTVSYGAPKESKDALDQKREKLMEALMESMQS